MRSFLSIPALALTLTIVACHPGAAQQNPSLSTPGPTFTVPANEIPPEWTVIGYGDTRFTDPSNTSVTDPKVRKWLVNQIATVHPDALLISGDLPYRGSETNDYAVFKTETEIWRTSHLRVYPALGNHELNGGEAVGLKNWWTAFPELDQRRWYSVSFGNAWFLMIDSDSPLTSGSPQQQWIAAQLKSLPSTVKFVFITMHHPIVGDDAPGFDHNVRPNEAALGEFLSATAKTLKARITVICGHVHNYERFEKDGITYLVAGGGAAKPKSVTRNAQDKFTGKDEVNYHYLTFHYDGKVIHAEMHRVADPSAPAPSFQVKDSFEIDPVQ
jgi:3',5'-cyclic AMP phosphodiesterase CpdA